MGQNPRPTIASLAILNEDRKTIPRKTHNPTTNPPRESDPSDQILRMRTRGTGSFKRRSYTRADGTVVTKWRGYLPAPDGTKHYGTGKTKREAESNARAKMKEAAAKTATGPVQADTAAPTFGEWLTTYNAHGRDTGKSDATVGKYRDHARHLSDLDPEDGKGPLGLRPITAVTFDVLELAVYRLSQRFAQNTVRNIQAYVAGALKRAYLLGMIDRPVGGLLKAISRKGKGVLELDDDGFAAMIRAAEGDAAMIAALVLGRYGLRIGEVCGVTSDDLRGNVLTLSRQLQRVDTSGTFGPRDAARPKEARTAKDGTTLSLCALKSESSARKIALRDVEANILMNALDGAKPDTVWDSVAREWVARLFVVPAPKGGAQETQRLRDRFTVLTKSIGLDATFHDLRALCATSLADDHTVKAISGLLGHRDAKTTEMYIREIRGMKTSALAVCDATSQAVAKALSGV